MQSWHHVTCYPRQKMQLRRCINFRHSTQKANTGYFHSCSFSYSDRCWSSSCDFSLHLLGASGWAYAHWPFRYLLLWCLLPVIVVVVVSVLLFLFFFFLAFFIYSEYMHCNYLFSLCALNICPFNEDFCKHKFLILIWSNVSFFIWWWILFGLFSKKCLLMPRSWKCTCMFFL